MDYDFISHVASDVGTEQKFLPTENFGTQHCLNKISKWTDEHLMKLNAKKYEYMIFSRSEWHQIRKSRSEQNIGPLY